MYARIRYLWICLILITILTGCAEASSAASTSIATVSRPESPSPTDTPSPSAAAIVWPEEDYAALGGAPDADAEIRWSAEPVLRAEEAGQTVYGLDGTLRQPGGQAIIQLHAPAEDEAAFQTAIAPFTEVTGWMASTL